MIDVIIDLDTNKNETRVLIENIVIIFYFIFILRKIKYICTEM